MPTTIKIKNIPEGYQSIISNGRHSILGDEPLKAKGTDLGFSPPEFVLAGISMCKVATVRNVARRNGWEIGNVDALLTQKVIKKPDGSLVTKVTSAITIEGDISKEQRHILIKEADNCYVTRLISGEWEFEESKKPELV